MSKKDVRPKVFILDTSSIIYQPLIVNFLGDNIIIIPVSNLSELDGLKKQEGNVGYNAREAIACIEELTNNDLNPSAIKHGVRTKGGGKLFFDFVKPEDWQKLPDGIEHNNDARVILAALKSKVKFPGHDVRILSEDSNLRVIARTCGVRAEGYKNDTVIQNLDDLYSGRESIVVTEPSADLMDKTFQKLLVPISDISKFLPSSGLYPNQCVELTIGSRFALAIHQAGNLQIFPATDRGVKYQKLPIVLKNNEQKLGHALAIDPVTELVTFSGKTGSGKSFLSLLGAYAQTRLDDSKRIMVFRPHIEIGPQFGILPGGVNEKFAPWMRPVIEIMRKIVKAYNGYTSEEARVCIDEMLQIGTLEINPISHIRGCTFDEAVMVIDEGQNLTPHEMRSTVTRAGENSRIFITGDPTQVDNRFLDSRNNGLVFLTERFKGDLNFGHLTFFRSVRSALAEKAANLLA